MLVCLMGSVLSCLKNSQSINNSSLFWEEFFFFFFFLFILFLSWFKALDVLPVYCS